MLMGNVRARIAYENPIIKFDEIPNPSEALFLASLTLKEFFNEGFLLDVPI